MSCQFSGQWSALWPQFSDGSKKRCWFLIHSAFFLLDELERWLSSSLCVGAKIRNSVHWFLKKLKQQLFLKKLFIYLFLAVLGLRFCARALSSCGKWGPLFIVVRGPLTIVASLVAEHRLQMRRLSSCGARASVAPWHVGSSQTRARTHVPCISRQILNHCATREAPVHWFLNVKSTLYSWEKISLGHGLLLFFSISGFNLLVFCSGLLWSWCILVCSFFFFFLEFF